jgi:hypothetical protein
MLNKKIGMCSASHGKSTDEKEMRQTIDRIIETNPLHISM